MGRFSVKRVLWVLIIFADLSRSMDAELVPARVGVARSLYVEKLRRDFLRVRAVTSQGIFSEERTFENGVPFWFCEIPEVGRVGINVDGGLMITAEMNSNFPEIYSDVDATVDSVSCLKLKLSAPSVLVTGETSAPEFLVMITGLSSDRGMKISGNLHTRELCVIGGNIYNGGTVDFDAASGRMQTELDIANDGEIRGCCDLSARTLHNNRNIIGDRINFRGDSLINDGTIGREHAMLKFTLREHMSNTGAVVGFEAEFSVGGQRSFFNDGTLNLSKVQFVGPENFVNGGFVSLKEFDGSVVNCVNYGNFDAPELSLKADTVCNHGFMDIHQLEIEKSFRNQSQSRQVAAFQSARGIKFNGAFVEASGTIKTDLSIPGSGDEIARAIPRECSASGRPDGHIVNMRPGFWDRDAFDLNGVKSAVDFYIFAENFGNKVRFSLFRRGAEKFSLNLTESGFNGFGDHVGDCFCLYRREENIGCYLFDLISEVAYGFSVDFGGNIELSAGGESATGVEREVTYAFHTNNAIRNRNPIAFHSLITDSRELYNFDVLKAKNYLFRYMYRYNSGILDLKSSHSASTDIRFFRDATFSAGNRPRSLSGVGEEGNFGVIIGDETSYFGVGSIFGFCGMALFDKVNFAGSGNSIEIRGGVLDAALISGNADSFAVKNSSETRGCAAFGQMSLDRMKTLNNEGILLIKKHSEVRAKNIFLTGIIAAVHSAEIVCEQITGEGSALGGDSLLLTRDLPISRPEVKLTAPRLIVREITPAGQTIEKDYKGDATVGKEFISCLDRQFEVVRKGSKILDRLEDSENENIRAMFKECGASNRLFALLKKAGPGAGEISCMLSSPYACGCIAADFRIFDLCGRLPVSEVPNGEIGGLFQSAVILKTHLEHLRARTLSAFEIYIEACKKHWFSMEETPLPGRGMSRFLGFVNAVGIDELTAMCTEDPSERKLYADAFGYIKRLADERLNLK
jgi:hypothetical protein